MVFSSSIFLFLFLPITLAGYYFLRTSIRWKNYFLLIMSICFYAAGEPIYVFLMIASIIGNYLFGHRFVRLRLRCPSAFRFLHFRP